MSNPLTDARTTITAALKAGLPDVPVHAGPQKSLQPPCIVLLPSEDPWYDQTGVVGLELACISGLTAGTPNGLQRLEDLLYRAREALYTAGYSPGEVRIPTAEEAAATFEARFNVHTRTTCR